MPSPDRDRTVLEPPHAGQERDTLLGFLQRQRDLVAWKLAGLTDEAARGVATPSGLTVHGLVLHLENVERGWLREVFAGEQGLPFDSTEDDPEGDFRVAPDRTLADLLAAYAQESALGDAVVATASLDDMCVTRPFSLRWVLHHLVEETARHLGHLDLLVELADGRTGEEPPGLVTS